MCFIFSREKENFLKLFSVSKNACIRTCIVLRNCRFAILHFSQKILSLFVLVVVKGILVFCICTCVGS